MRVRFPPGTAGGNRTWWVRLIRVARPSPTSQGGSPSTSHRFPLAPFPRGTAGNEPVVRAGLLSESAATATPAASTTGIFSSSLTFVRANQYCLAIGSSHYVGTPRPDYLDAGALQPPPGRHRAGGDHAVARARAVCPRHRSTCGH